MFSPEGLLLFGRVRRQGNADGENVLDGVDGEAQVARELHLVRPGVEMDESTES